MVSPRDRTASGRGRGARPTPAPRSPARSAVPRTPSATGPTSSTSSTSSTLPAHFAMQRCRRCGSEFLTRARPRPSSRPSTRATTTPTTRTTERVARLLVEVRARSRARFYGRLIPDGPGRLFDVGTGDCRHFDELRRVPRPRVRRGSRSSRRSPPRAGPGAMTCSRERLETADLSGHLGHLRRGVDEPRPRARGLPADHAGAGPRPPAAGWIRDRPAPDGLVLGADDCSGGTGAATTTPGTFRSPRGRVWPGCSSEVGFHRVAIRSAPHIQTTISLQNTLVSRGWRPPHAVRQDPDLLGAAGRLPALRDPWPGCATRVASSTSEA